MHASPVLYGIIIFLAVKAAGQQLIYYIGVNFNNLALCIITACRILNAHPLKYLAAGVIKGSFIEVSCCWCY
jgi:hypothetical protein